MKFVVEIEKLKNSTLKQVAKDFGWDGNNNLYDWLEVNTKRFDCDITDDEDFGMEGIICDLLNTYKDNNDIIEAVNKLPDDVFNDKDKENLIDDACSSRRYKLAEDIWREVKNTLEEDFNDISSYKHDREYEIYNKEWDRDNKVDFDDIVCTIDNDGNVLVEIKER